MPSNQTIAPFQLLISFILCVSILGTSLTSCLFEVEVEEMFEAFGDAEETKSDDTELKDDIFIHANSVAQQVLNTNTSNQYDIPCNSDYLVYITVPTPPPII